MDDNDRPGDYAELEYQTAQDSAQHHDQLIWTSTSLMWVASLVLLGFVLQGLRDGTDRLVLTAAAGLGVGMILVQWRFRNIWRGVMTRKYEACQTLERLDGFAAKHHSREARDYPRGAMGRLYVATSLAFISVWIFLVATLWWPSLLPEHAVHPPAVSVPPATIQETTGGFLQDYGALLIGAGTLVVSGFLAFNQLAVRRLQAQILRQQRATSDLQAKALALSEHAQDWNERRLSPMPVLLPLRCTRSSSGPSFQITFNISNPGDVPLFVVSMFLKAHDAKGLKVFEVKGEPERPDDDTSVWESMQVDAHGVRAFRLTAQTLAAKQATTPGTLDMSLTFIAGDRGGVLNCSTFKVRELGPSELGKIGNWDQAWWFVAGQGKLHLTGLQLVDMGLPA
jgi:hypothetical protein